MSLFVGGDALVRAGPWSGSARRKPTRASAAVQGDRPTKPLIRSRFSRIFSPALRLRIRLSRPCEDRAAQAHLPWPLMPIRDPDWTLASGGGQKELRNENVALREEIDEASMFEEIVELATVDDRTSD